MELRSHSWLVVEKPKEVACDDLQRRLGLEEVGAVEEVDVLRRRVSDEEYNARSFKYRDYTQHLSIFFVPDHLGKAVRYWSERGTEEVEVQVVGYLLVDVLACELLLELLVMCSRCGAHETTHVEHSSVRRV